MKKKIFITFCFIIPCFAFVILLVGCNSNKQLKNRTNYRIVCAYDNNLHTLTGSEVVTFYNFYDNMFQELYFHLYPNAFRSDAKNKVVSVANFDKAYPNGESSGDILIKNVKVNDISTEFSITGEDENILQVDLQQDLYPEQSVNIEIEFVVTLANINHRLGYGNNTINIGNFYPILAVYDEGVGFMTSPYHSNGDPFYSECSDYEVEIVYDKNLSLASSGNVVITEKNGMNKAKIKGEKIRDFCFVLSNKFEMVSGNCGDITINYWGYKGDSNLDSSLKTSIEAVATFNELFGDYPYSTLNIVKSNFVHGGMEYPNLVLISDEVSSQDLAYVIVHEIAHQWWYGVVGNNEYDYAWIDEGLTEYSTFLFFENHSEYGFNYSNMISNALESYKLFEKIYIKITGSVDSRIDRPLDEFETEPEYVQCVYNKTVLMFDSIRNSVGKKKFLKAMKDLYNDYAFQNITPAMLINSFSNSTGSNLEGFFNSWLEGKVVIK